MYPYTRTHPLSPVVNTYKCSDGNWYYLGSSDFNVYFPKAARALGLDEIAENEDYCTIMGMLMNVEEIVKMFEDKFIQKTTHEWKKIFDDADVPGEIVFTWQDVLHDDQALENGFLEKIDYSNGNKGLLATTPVRFGSMGKFDYRLPGGVGCNSVEILEELGISKEEIEKMKEEKIIAG